MDKKIVFSLVLLSTFAYADRPELAISGADDCLTGATSLDNLKKCTTLRKDVIKNAISGRNENDHFYFQCLSQEQDLTTHSSYFNLNNILTQHTSTYNNPEKVRYEALAQCGIKYFDSRMFSAYKQKYHHNGNWCDSQCNNFISSYKDIVSKKGLESSNQVCKSVLATELNYANSNETNLDKIDFAPYFAAIGYQKPEIQDLAKSKTYTKSIKLKSDVDGVNNDRKVLQEYYKEFTTNTTGKVMVSSSMTVVNRPYIIYLLDQQEPLVNVNGEWYPEIYRNYADLIGDVTLSDNGFLKGKGCNYVDSKFNMNDSLENWDGNKLLTFKENGNWPDMQGVCDVYRQLHERVSGGYDFDRAKEMLILKNSKVKPLDYNNYFASYNDSPNHRTNDYAGGTMKCYNFDIEHFTSKYSRASYFDWNNARDFVRDNAFATFKRQHWMFSIHKQGTKKGVFSNTITSQDPTKELSKYNFSVNVRPSAKVNKQYNSLKGREIVDTAISELSVKFIPDANTFVITDKANGHELKRPLRITDLNDVFIGLDNTKTSFNADDRKPNGDIKIRYFLSSFDLTKQKIANAYGKVEEVKQNIKVPTNKIELFPVEDTNNKFGLTMSKETLKSLLNVTDKDIEDGNQYEITFTPKEIVEEINEPYEYEECPKSGNCSIKVGNRTYTRPMYQETGKDIIKGKPGGNVTIILGNVSMPNGATLGSAYTNNNSAVVKNNVVSQGVQVADKIYTRTSSQDIFLGFKLPSSYSTKDRFIKFLNANDDELDADVYVNGLRQTKQVENASNKTCGGYYKLSNEMIIKLNHKLPVSQNNVFKYKIAELDTIFDECVELGKKQSNEFSIRPDSLTYSVNAQSDFEKLVGKVDDKYINNNVVFTSSLKDDRFGVGIAELTVDYASKSKGNKMFNLEDKNSNLLNKLTDTSVFASFDKTTGNFEIKTVFPLVTDAKISLAENKFTYDDFKNGLCSNTNKALSKEDANKIGIDGKINCQTPGNEINVNFVAKEALDYDKDSANKDIVPYVKNTNFINLVPFSDSSNERLVFAMQLANTVGNSYFYKKYSNDTASSNLELSYQKMPQDSAKLIVNVMPTDLSITKVDNSQFNISGLNEKFDEKLGMLDIKNKLSEYADDEFDAKNSGKITFEIGYPKYWKNRINVEKSFAISNANYKISFADGKEILKNNIMDGIGNIEFYNVGLFYKDINKNKTGKKDNYAIDYEDSGLMVYDDNDLSRAVQLDKKYIKSYKNLYNSIASSVELTSDYSNQKMMNKTYVIPTSVKNNQYVKDTLRFNITNPDCKYLDSNSTFTIEFAK